MKLTTRTTGEQADIVKLLTPLQSTAQMQAVCIAQSVFADESKRAAVWPALRKGRIASVEGEGVRFYPKVL